MNLLLGLNSCLNQIERLIASNQNVNSEDLATIQSLRQKFGEELELVSSRLDNLTEKNGFT